MTAQPNLLQVDLALSQIKEWEDFTVLHGSVKLAGSPSAAGPFSPLHLNDDDDPVDDGDNPEARSVGEDIEVNDKDDNVDSSNEDDSEIYAFFPSSLRYLDL